MGLAVIQPGLYSTVQDLGRTGYRAFGVPLGGIFDGGSADLANALLGNPETAAVIEMTLLGGTFEARGPLALALAGAPFVATARTRAGRETTLTVPVSFALADGDRLMVGGAPRGTRVYLAVLGGWRTPVMLGSRSSESPIPPGSILECEPGWVPVRRPAPDVNPFETTETSPLRVIDGPDAERVRDRDWLDGDRIYRVGAQSDRMGLRLEGPTGDVVSDPARVSCPVAPGAIQAAGKTLIVLGVASGTMGGYPHVAHVISADLNRLAQARPGDPVRFTRVSLTEARRLGQDARTARAVRRSRVVTAAGDRLRV